MVAYTCKFMLHVPNMTLTFCCFLICILWS